MAGGRGERGWGWGGSLTPFSPLPPNPSPPPQFGLQWFLCPRRGRGESERNDSRMNSLFGFHQPTPTLTPANQISKNRVSISILVKRACESTTMTALETRQFQDSRETRRPAEANRFRTGC